MANSSQMVLQKPPHSPRVTNAKREFGGEGILIEILYAHEHVCIFFFYFLFVF